MAFSTTFSGTAGTNLITADSNWTHAAFGSAPGANNASANALQIATGNTGLRDQNVGTNTCYHCPDQGVDGSNAQYIKVVYASGTPNNQLRPTCFFDSLGQKGVWFSVTTSNFMLVRYGSLSAPTTAYTGTTAVSVGDVVILSVTGPSSNTHARVYINGTEDGASVTWNNTTAPSGFNNTASGTRQGIQVLSGQSVIDPWLTSFEAGSGAGITASGAAAVAARHILSSSGQS